MYTSLNVEEKLRTDNIHEFLKSLSVEEQKGFSIFMQGVKFAKQIPAEPVLQPTGT